MHLNLTAARKSTRRYSTGTEYQRRVWRSHYQTLLMDGGMTEMDASYEATCRDDWDGMDTPVMAAKTRLTS